MFSFFLERGEKLHLRCIKCLIKRSNVELKLFETPVA